MATFVSARTRSVQIALAVACVCACGGVFAAVADSVTTTVVGNDGDGAVSATTVPLQNLSGGCARDSSGKIYFVDGNRIMALTSAGALTLVAGQQSNGFQGDGAPATTALLDTPVALTTDPNDNLYFYDSGNVVIRRISKSGIISTVAGNKTSTTFIQDIGRFATDAAMPDPVQGIAVNAAGDIFFGATGAGPIIYQVPAATGRLSIFAGNGTTGFTVNGATALTSPLGNTGFSGLALLSDGSLIFGIDNIGIVQIASGKLNVIAGLLNGTNQLIAGTIVYPDNGTQAAFQTTGTTGFSGIGNIAVDGSTIFFVDFAVTRIRSFTVGGKVSTVFGEISEAGSGGGFGFRGNGTPAATNTLLAADFTVRNDDPKSRINSASQLVASGGVVTFVDQSNTCVRQFTVGGNVNTIAGAPNIVRRDAGFGFPFDQLITNTSPVDAKSIIISSPRQIARDPSNGTFVFDALDITNTRNLFRYDPVAKQVSIVAGIALTNANPTRAGDGGPAVGALLSGLGTQAVTLSDGTVMFADTAPGGVSAHVIRAISPTGVLSTVAGIPLHLGNRNPDVDLTILNAGGVAVNQARIGSKATSVLLNHPDSLVATSVSDFVIADTNNSRIVVVQGGTVTADIAGVPTPTYIASISPTVVAVASGGNLFKVDFTTIAAPVVTGPFATSVAGIRGLVVGTLSGGPVIFVSGGVNIDVRQQTAGFPEYYAAAFVVPVPGATALIGLGSDASNLYVTDNGANKLSRIPIAQFNASAIATPPPVIAPTTIATNLLGNVSQNGFNIQTNFSLTAFAPVTPLGSNILVGDDGANQYRLLTLGATAPATTFVPFAGTGVERNGGTDGGEPATNADDIGQVGGIAIDSTGAVFFSDHGQQTVRKVANGAITTVAGIPNHGVTNNDFVDGVNALQTTFNSPDGLAFNAAGELFISDSLANVVRKLKTDGTIVNVAGTAINGGSGGGGDLGTALAARLSSPEAIVVNPHGDLYILEGSPGRVRLVDLNGNITTLAGGGGDVPDYNPTDSLDLDLPVASITLDAAGKVFVSGRVGSPGAGIVRIAGGLGQLVCGDRATSGFNGDGLSIDRILSFGSTPCAGIAFDGGSGIVFCDSGNDLVRMITNLGETGNSAPSAEFVATPDLLNAAPFKPHFDASSSVDADGDIVTYQWDFGDGSLGDGEVLDHVYSAMGSYVVALTVTDSAGHTSTARHTVVAANPILNSTATGKGTFKIDFSGKKNADAFSFSVTGVTIPGSATGINFSGQPFTLFLGTFTSSGVVAGKGAKKGKPSTLATPLAAKKGNTSVTIDTVKGTVAASVKSATLAPAFADFGVTPTNSPLGTRSALVPVVINIGNGTVIFGDKLNFFFKTKVKTSKGKTTGSAQGKFSQ
jgi:hypothetical protein